MYFVNSCDTSSCRVDVYSGQSVEIYETFPHLVKHLDPLGVEIQPELEHMRKSKLGLSSPQIGVKIKHNLKPPPKSSSTSTYTIHGSYGLGALVI